MKPKKETGREEINTCSPEPYKVDDRKYEFPFKVLDNTPGGSNLGRIQWMVEMHPARKKKGRVTLKEIWVWAKQTRDSRYRGKIFKIETWAETISMGNNLRESYAPWRVFFCEKHKGAVILDAYPKDHHQKLVICPFSNISCEIDFN